MKTVDRIVVGLGGVTCGGKSTIARLLKDKLMEDDVDGINVVLLNQDEYYVVENRMKYLPEYDYCHWDEPSSVDFDKLSDNLEKNLEQCQTLDNNHKKLVIIVEGNMIFQCDRLSGVTDLRYFFRGSYEDIKRIRETRVYDPPDKPGYFDGIVWPAYLNHEAECLKANSGYYTILHATGSQTSLDQNVSQIFVEIKRRLYKNWVKIVEKPILLDDALKFVSDEACGAEVLFVGTVRNHCDGRIVKELRYDCYLKMASRKMHEICQSIRGEYSNVCRIAIFHRTGSVLVGENCLIVAISTPHRCEAFNACQSVVNKVKRSVPIWKNEIYVDNSSAWKSN